MRLWVEKCYPTVFAVCAAFAWWRFSPDFPKDEKEFLGAAISIGSILTGFIATAKAILAALPSDSVMKRIRSSGYMKEAIRYLASGLYGCLIFSVYGIAGFFFLSESPKSLNNWYAVGWIFLATYALFSFHRVAAVLIGILSHNSEQD